MNNTNNATKKNIKVSNKLIIYIFLVISFVFCITMTSFNLYYNGVFGKIDKTQEVTYFNFMDKSDKAYYVYMYEKDTFNEDMKRDIVSYQHSKKDDNCPLYTFNVTIALNDGYLTKLDESGNRVENLVGQTNRSEITIGNHVPILLYIKKNPTDTGEYFENVVITRIVGTSNIQKQLEIPMEK